MSKPVAGALEQALACMASPGLLVGARASVLPDDVLVLLRLAANDQACLAEHAGRLGLPARRLHDAAVFYIQQVLFAQGADSYRVLGANADVSDTRLREHYRWLVRWLHPDRNSNEWEDVYLDRVHRAWQQLRNPERRRVHDLAVAHVPQPAAPVVRSESVSRRAVITPLPRARSASPRVFPVLGLGTALVALVALVANYPLAMEEADGPVHSQAMATEPPPAQQLALLPARDVEPAPMVPAVVSRVDEEVAATATAEAVAQPLQSSSATALTATSTAVKPLVAPKPAPISIVSRVAAATPARQVLAKAVQAPATRAEPENRVAAPVVAPTAPQTAVAVSRMSVPVVQRAVATPVAKPTAAAVVAAVAPQPVVERPAPVVVAKPADVAVAAIATPPSSGLAAVSVATSRLPINDRVAFGLVQKFRRAYNDGDLEQVMALFAREARHPDGGGREAIVESFRREFESRTRARITVGRPDWRVEDQHAVVVASYRAQRAGMAGPDGQESSGNIRFELRQEDGQMRIALVQPHRF